MDATSSKRIVGRVILILVALVLIGYGVWWISNGMVSFRGESKFVEGSPAAPEAKDRKT